MVGVVSALPSILARFHRVDGPHVRVAVFAGPDAQHRAHLGTLTARKEEADALESLFVGAGYDVEHADGRWNR